MFDGEATPAGTEEFTADVAARTAPLYERVRSVIPDLEWPVVRALHRRDQRLKRQRNAVVLAHNYQTPEIFHGVADFVGDSLALAQQGAKTDADVIVLAGVHFMAETAKILSPEKTVLIPDLGPAARSPPRSPREDIRLLRQRYPGVPVVTYVNTSAAVKAESDICCTSANAVAVVESLGVDRVIFLPDEYLGQVRGLADQGPDHPLAGTLRGARALHRRRSCALPPGAGRASRSSPIPSARRTCWPRPTSWAPRRR